MVPPSVHPDTHQPYRWQVGYSPFELELPLLPEWVCEMMAPRPAPERIDIEVRLPDAYVQKAIAEELSEVASAPQGHRNTTLNDAAFRAVQIRRRPEGYARRFGRKPPGRSTGRRASRARGAIDDPQRGEGAGNAAMSMARHGAVV